MRVTSPARLLEDPPGEAALARLRRSGFDEPERAARELRLVASHARLGPALQKGMGSLLGSLSRLPDALGALDRIGSLEVGKFADMIVIDTSPVHATPMFDPMTHIVFSTAKSDVRDVFVGGRRVVADGALTRVDIGETLTRVRALAPAIAASIA